MTTKSEAVQAVNDAVFGTDQINDYAHEQGLKAGRGPQDNFEGDKEYWAAHRQAIKEVVEELNSAVQAG
jgi:hypothetical protein